MLKKLILISTLILFCVLHSYPQTSLGFICNTSASSIPPTPYGMGLSKPVKTPPTNDINAYLRVMMVFIEFANETESSAHWPIGSLPDYANNLFAPQKELGINAYQNYTVSNYFNQISNDQFDMIGDVYHVTLSHPYSFYTSLAQAQIEAFSILDNVYQVDWNLYDLWRWNPSTQQYEQFADNYIDMIYTQYRKINPFSVGFGGVASTLADYTTRDGKFISSASISYTGSGVTGVNGALLGITDVIGLFRHEYCHYLLGDHRPYSTILGEDGTYTICGSEVGFSPQDLITVGLANVTTYDGSTNSFQLRDMVTTGVVLKVPTGVTGQYFLVSNRRRIAGNGTYTWDCNMLGDTAMGVPFLQFGDYSKGLYIYHISDGDNFQAWPDLEAADGLWNWEHAGVTTPDWSNSQTLAVLEKTSAGYDDDNPQSAYFNDNSRYLSRDGQSVISQNSNPYPGWGQKWFSKGKRHTVLGGRGTDRIFTNDTNDWTSRELMGDRWDAWGVGYNQVFSPYSSPNTKKRDNTQSGIFIYYESLNGNTASVKVYNGAAGTPAETYALQMTPPSRPMNIKIDPCYQPTPTDYFRNKITWNHNMEPDMRRLSRGSYLKRYKIYRVAAANMSLVPDESAYTEIATVDIDENTAPSFVDNSIISGCNSPPDAPCPPICWTLYPVRYRVSAVDNTEWESVKSDFSESTAWNTQTNGGKGTGTFGKPHGELPIIPTEYNLFQNYPNPFNPSTEIKFDLPKYALVTVKIYNALGEEVAILLNNEFRDAGRYSVIFDGSNLASGIYFYTIKAGTFSNTKKMVLIK